MTLSILLLGRWLGFIPDESKNALEARKQFCESLAVQVSISASKNDLEILHTTLETVVERNTEILSVALRNYQGIALFAGDHKRYWVDVPLDKSTATHVQVPIIANNLRWGTLEVAFKDLKQESQFSLGTLGGMLLFVAFFGFVLYLIFMKRTLRELDPKAVIPERVRSAFNALSEGLIILDEKDQIILANESFTDKIDLEEDLLIGMRADELAWKKREKGIKVDVFPWHSSIRNLERKTGIPMRLELGNKTERTFSVNTAPIYDAKGKARGVLATFDDMTDLETKHRELKSTLKKLRSSEQALRDKTVELEQLATRDPLTGCYNRRAFFDKYDKMFAASQKTGTGLVFVMIDIDHFKSINDQYGHSSGDKVIKFVAEILMLNSRPEDLVGRYGGEEFSLVMPQADIEQALMLAERLRNEIQQKGYDLFTGERTVTASFGLAPRSSEINDQMMLVSYADDALYVAKEQGRNRAVVWDYDMVENSRGSNNKEHGNSQHPVNSTGSQSEQAVTREIADLENMVKDLELELEYSRKEIKRREGKDELTGLPNKIIFTDRMSQVLARCKRYNKSAAVLSLDIDDFTKINEAFGYTTGDQVLKIVSCRLLEMLRITDTVAVIDEEEEKSTSAISRMNNDEFALILTDLNDVDSVSWAVRRILKQLDKPFEVNGQELYVSFSAGVSLYPNDDDIPIGLLQKAAAARRSLKQNQSKSEIQFFSEDINREAYKKAWLEIQLHKAIKNADFELFFQPYLQIKSGRITCIEALVRWPHEKVGYIPPAEFIPIAEHTGLIHELGLWVLESACRRLQLWHEMGYHDLRIAVNMSAVQLHKKDLSKKVIKICNVSGIDPKYIEIEITESALIDNFSEAEKIMRKLSDAGIRFVLDDFGMGYSSLNYLRKLPIHGLKLDRSFVDDALLDEQDQAILHGIISIANNLDLRVIAEGIETKIQEKVLSTLGCQEAQGMLYCEPVGFDNLSSMLKHHNYIESSDNENST
ncbi:MAG: diguanylate cyclase [Candidatus Thiodiazotropha sp. LLP2]